MVLTVRKIVHATPILVLSLLSLLTTIKPAQSLQQPLPQRRLRTTDPVHRHLLDNSNPFLVARGAGDDSMMTTPLKMSNDNTMINGDANGSTKHPLHMQLLSSIGSTTSTVVSVTFFVVLAYKRDAIMISFFIGSILNGVLSKVLKKLLNQERPAELETANMKLKPSDNGMPSSHAMSLGFIGTFTGLSLSSWWIQLSILVYVCISLIYRVQTNLHTVEQVLVGIVIGTCNGAIWRLYLCNGNNPLGINVVDWVSSTFLNNESGVLPWPMLIIPAVVGAVVVGSFERRISAWIKKGKEE